MPIKFLLILCTFVSLAACGNDTTERDAQIKESGTEQVPSSSYIRETEAGNYLSAMLAQRQKDWNTASQYLTKLTVQSPNDEEIKQRAMLVAMGSGQVDLAFTYAKDLLENDPENLWALIFSILEHIALQDYAAAQTKLDQIPGDSISAFMAPLITTWIESSKGQLPALSEDSLALHDFHILLSAAYLGQLDNIKEKDLDRMVKQPFDTFEKERLADLFALSGMNDRAIILYDDLLINQPNNLDLVEKINRVKVNNDIRELIEYKQVSSPHEGISRAFFDIAKLLFREYNDESAQIFGHMSLYLTPDLTDTKVLLAHIQNRAGRYEDAISYYFSVSKDDPSYLAIQYQSANLLDEMEQYDEALELLWSLYEEYEDVNALLQIGDIHRRQDDHKEAIKIYNKAFDKLGDDFEDKYWVLYYARGMAHEQNKNWGSAEKDLRKALEFQPNHAYLLNYLGYSLADRELALDEALDMIQKAVALKPEDGFIIDSLGWVFYRLGEYEKAVPYLERAVELLPYDPTVNDHLGDAYWMVNRKLEARFQWKRAINHLEDTADKDEDFARIQDKIKKGLDKPVAIVNDRAVEAQGASALTEKE